MLTTSVLPFIAATWSAVCPSKSHIFTWPDHLSMRFRHLVSPSRAFSVTSDASLHSLTAAPWDLRNSATSWCLLIIASASETILNYVSWLSVCLMVPWHRRKTLLTFKLTDSKTDRQTDSQAVKLTDLQTAVTVMTEGDNLPKRGVNLFLSCALISIPGCKTRNFTTSRCPSAELTCLKKKNIIIKIIYLNLNFLAFSFFFENWVLCQHQMYINVFNCIVYFRKQHRR